MKVYAWIESQKNFKEDTFFQKKRMGVKFFIERRYFYNLIKITYSIVYLTAFYKKKSFHLKN